MIKKILTPIILTAGLAGLLGNVSADGETAENIRYDSFGSMEMRGVQIDCTSHLSFELNGREYLFLDRGDDVVLDNKPDAVVITENDEELVRLSTERTTDRMYGDLYREVRNELVLDYATKFMGLVDQKNENIKITESPIVEYKKNGVKKVFGGDIEVSVTTEDDIVIVARESKGNGVTDSFYVAKKVGEELEEIIDMRADTSDFATESISNLVEYALEGK
jgi:hypothetical protein